MITFKQFLLEDDDEDIVSGIRKLVTDIRTNWKSPYSATRKEQERLWKKLPPAAQAALRQQFELIVSSALTDVAQPLKLTGFNPASKLEAQVIVATFERLAKDLQEQIGPKLLQFVSSGPSPILTDDEAEGLKNQYNVGSVPMDRPLGQVTRDFVVKHQQELKRLYVNEDSGAFGYDIYQVPQNLAKALGATPEDKRKESTIGLHYLTLRMAYQFADASRQLARQYTGQNLPAEPPEAGKPPGGIKSSVTKP